jgi:hypothetical protein
MTTHTPTRARRAAWLLLALLAAACTHAPQLNPEAPAPASPCTEPDAALLLVDPDTGEYVVPDSVALLRDGHDRNCKRPAAP